MVSSRSAALEAVITTALERREFNIADIEAVAEGTSHRTIRRALNDAQEFDWVEKKSTDGKSWQIGDKARRHRIASRDSGYPNTEMPVMYYASTSHGAAQDCLYGEFVLASAGSAWISSGTGFGIGIPDSPHLMVDSGGYQAATKFGTEYPYSPKQLNKWAEDVGADVVFGMDWACEDADQLAKVSNTDESNIADWEDRFEWSFEDQLEHFEEHQQGRYSHEFRPVIQGHDPEDFEQFAHMVKESPMPTDAIAIGTVCKRAKLNEIYDVTKSVKQVLPDAKIHLFGATLNIWNDERFANLFDSSDSAAWINHDPENTDSMFPTGADSEERAYRSYKNKVQDSVVREHRQS